MALFTMGTGGHYITMLPSDWSISTSQYPLPSSYHSEKMLWNPSTVILGSIKLLSCSVCGVTLYSENWDMV